MAESYINPGDVSQEDAWTVLEFLNGAKTAREIAEAVEIPDERDVGLEVAQRILVRRSELGTFTSLQQVRDVPQVGPERFTEIVTCLSAAVRNVRRPLPAVYWTENTIDRVRRVSFDGLVIATVLETGPAPSGPFAITSFDGKIYFSDFIKNRISRANLEDGMDNEVIVTGVDSPFGLAIDTARGKLYWTNQSAKTIQRANLDGTDVEDVLTGLGAGAGMGIVDLDIDVKEKKLYWTDISDRTVNRANLDGSAREIVVHEPAGSQPTNVAVDPFHGLIFWSDHTNKRIRRSDMSGTRVKTIIEIPDGSPRGIDVDVTRPQILFGINVLKFSPPLPRIVIRRAEYDGSNLHDVVDDDRGELGGICFVPASS